MLHRVGSQVLRPKAVLQAVKNDCVDEIRRSDVPEELLQAFDDAVRQVYERCELLWLEMRELRKLANASKISSHVALAHFLQGTGVGGASDSISLCWNDTNRTPVTARHRRLALGFSGAFLHITQHRSWQTAFDINSDSNERSVSNRNTFFNLVPQHHV